MGAVRSESSANPHSLARTILNPFSGPSTSPDVLGPVFHWIPMLYIFRITIRQRIDSHALRALEYPGTRSACRRALAARLRLARTNGYQIDRCPLRPMLAEIMTGDGSVVSFSIEADPHESMTRPIVDVSPAERML